MTTLAADAVDAADAAGVDVAAVAVSGVCIWTNATTRQTAQQLLATQNSKIGLI